MNRLKQILLYGGKTKEEYESVQTERQDNNRNIWRIGAIIAWLVSVYLMLSSFSLKDLEGNRGVYLMLLALSTVLGILMFTVAVKRKRWLPFLIFAYMIELLAGGIFLGVAQTPDQMTVTFHVLMIVLPLLVITAPINIFLLEGCMLTAYCLVCFRYKTDTVLAIDVYNGVTFFAVAQILNYLMLKIKLNELLLRKKIEQIGFTDTLTGLCSRNAYERDLASFGSVLRDRNLVYVSLDINGLKTANDTLGHTAGDELICGAAECLKICFADYGKVYRIGGDEMAAIVSVSPQKLEELLWRFRGEAAAWRGTVVPALSVSLGSAAASEREGIGIVELAKLSDSRMYEEKAAYYARSAGRSGARSPER